MAAGKAYFSSAIFDGTTLREDVVLLVEGGRVTGVVPAGEVPGNHEKVDLGDGTLAPGLVDLQVNGGGGLMLGEIESVDDLARICRAHIGLGTTALLPTLITDTLENTRKVLKIGGEAARQKVPGFAGLHLEGPHLDPARKGAHDARLIRPMEARDLDVYLEAARTLPSLMITAAPESVTPDQIRKLTEAGVTVSLGHSNATYDAVHDCVKAGATCMTHLYNAMSPLAHREPGMVGAGLNIGQLHAGLIADGLHVDPAAVEIALRAKKGPGAIFLVTDAMAVAGTEQTEFSLGGRRILRADGRLTLEDGTLAGADITLPAAIRFLQQEVGLTLETALRMATSLPAATIGRQDVLGCLVSGGGADFIQLSSDGSVRSVWLDGVRQR
ncbi:N-acetylglucosamine-6-phosphate deacetylase [uncultured Roseibium sp.]|uniref:N-acetylglucosamine-6-phosphate deacetylase n=1 Tax=uncultured Roseibium sp. TaxID=1936171 RepID=UPI003217FAB3